MQLERLDGNHLEPFGVRLESFRSVRGLYEMYEMGLSKTHLVRLDNLQTESFR